MFLNLNKKWLFDSMNIYSYRRWFAVMTPSVDNLPTELDEHTLFLTTQTFKALSDQTRVRILILLSQKECSVNEIAQCLSLSQSTVSHQLRFLKQLRLVKSRREGTMVYYSPNDEHVLSILKQTIDHVKHE